jgi:hypothetical protein
LTASLFDLAEWAEDGQAMPKNFHVLSFDSSVTVLLSNRVVGFAWIGLALAFVNKCSQKQEIITIFHHLSSSPDTTFGKPRHLFNPGAQVILLLCHGFIKFAIVLLGFFLPFDFTMRVSV